MAPSGKSCVVWMKSYSGMLRVLNPEELRRPKALLQQQHSQICLAKVVFSGF